jgi:hypothetical protein
LFVIKKAKVVKIEASLSKERIQIRFKIREGRRNSSLIRCNIPSTANPSMRKGNRRIQNTGYKIRARIANGQERMNNKIKSKKVSIIFFYKGLKLQP